MSLSIVLAMAVSAGQPATPPSFYAQCLARAVNRPADAEAEARNWSAHSGGPAALHCLGVAQVNAGQAETGATTLGKAAEAYGRAGGAPLRTAQIWAQSGNAWLLAGAPEKAFAALSRAIDMQATDGAARGDSLVDRARAAAALGDWSGAARDLGVATALLPRRPDVWLLLATAQRRAGNLPGAAGAIEKAYALAPEDPDIRLERGNARARAGDMAGARQDWRAAAELGGDNPSAVLARQNLEGANQGADAPRL